MIMWYHGITINPITVNYFIDIPLSNVRHINFKLYTLFLKANRIYRITSIKRPPQEGVYLKHSAISREKHVFTLFELLNEDIV